MAITNATRVADFGSGIGTQGAVLQVDNTNKRIGIGTTNPQAMLQVGTGVSVYGNSGIVSATSFYGDGSGLTGVANTDFINATQLNVIGVATASSFVGNVTGNASGLTGTPDITVNNITGVAATFTGVLTYEDVTNVDSVGIVTARGGLEIGAAGVGGTVTSQGNAIFVGVTTVGTGLTLADNVHARFGNDGDLKLYHNGTSSYIDNNTSHVYIRSNVDNDDGGNIYIQAKSGEDSIVCNDDGNVQLYYDNYNAFQTNANGIKVQGPSGGAAILYLNADQGSDDADKFRFKVEDDGPLKIENDTSGTWETSIEINGNGNVELYYDNSKKLETHNTGIRVTGIATVTTAIYVNTNGSSLAENNLNFASSGKAYIDHRTTSQDIDFRVSHGSALDRTAITVGSAGVTTFYDTPHDDIGSLRSIPLQDESSTANYILVASDAGQCVHAHSSTTQVTVNPSVFSTGDAVTIVNGSAGNIALTQGTSMTIRNTADSSTGSKTLASFGMCTLWFSAHNMAYLSGAGLS